MCDSQVAECEKHAFLQLESRSSKLSCQPCYLVLLFYIIKIEEVHVEGIIQRWHCFTGSITLLSKRWYFHVLKLIKITPINIQHVLKCQTTPNWLTNKSHGTSAEHAWHTSVLRYSGWKSLGYPIVLYMAQTLSELSQTYVERLTGQPVIFWLKTAEGEGKRSFRT